MIMFWLIWGHEAAHPGLKNLYGILIMKMKVAACVYYLFSCVGLIKIL